MTKTIRFTKNREAIYGLLTRAKKYHCTCASVHEFDITPLLEELKRARSDGRTISLNACLIKATGLVLKRYPSLNRHLFHGIFRKYIVEFEDISCNYIMGRTEGREIILLPVIINQSDQLTLEQIDEIIKYHKDTPLEQLPQIKGIERMKRSPLIAMKYFSYKCRSDHRFYRQYFGTYGLSSMIFEGEDGIKEGKTGIATQCAANTCAAFLVSSVSDEPVVLNGEIVSRKVLTFSLLMDHYVIDAHDGARAMVYLRRMFANPSELGI